MRRVNLISELLTWYTKPADIKTDFLVRCNRNSTRFAKIKCEKKEKNAGNIQFTHINASDLYIYLVSGRAKCYARENNGAESRCHLVHDAARRRSSDAYRSPN